MTWYARKRGRKRRIAGWLLLAIGVVTASSWLASRWWMLDCNRGSAGLRLYTGSLEVILHEHDMRSNSWSISFLTYSREIRWWHGWGREEFMHGWSEHYGLLSLHGWIEFGYERSTEIAAWPLWAVPAGLGWFFLRSSSRTRCRLNGGACGACGYPLAGLAAGSPCPECGKGKP